MMQPQSQLSQQAPAQGDAPATRFAASMSRIRTVAVSLLVDRALSA